MWRLLLVRVYHAGTAWVAGLLMQCGPASLGQDLQAHEDSGKGDGLEKRGGGEKGSAKRQVSFQGRQQLKGQNYQTKPQDHIRCQGRTRLLSPSRKGLSVQPITLMMWQREEEDLTQSEMKFSS